jgi:hypothetical protein
MTEFLQKLVNMFPAASILVIIIFWFVILYASMELGIMAIKWAWRKIREMV